MLEVCIALFLSQSLLLMIMTSYSIFLKLSGEIKRNAESIESGYASCHFLRVASQQAFKVRAILEPSLLHQTLKIKPLTDAFELQLMTQAGGVSAYFFISEMILASGQKHFAFFYKQQGKPRVQIASKIHNLQAWYGVKCLNSGNICHYFTARDVADWNQVRAIKLNLLLENQPTSQWVIYLALKKNS